MNKKEMFDLLNAIAEGIAKMFGNNCETLIQDLSLDSHPVLAIYNGHVSGREVGSEINIFGRKEGMRDRNFLNGHYVNTLVVKDRRKIKSTTFNIRGDDYFFGLGINYDSTAISDAISVLEDLTSFETLLGTAISDARRRSLEETVNACIQQIGKPPQLMKKADRIALIRLLLRENAFSYQKAVPLVAEKLGVSRYTIYNYLKEVNPSEDDMPTDEALLRR
ncbi:MAG: transcriptional regulator [Clostridiales bacterium]|nr:transcriptional regulator [Clostridiales bacterium]